MLAKIKNFVKTYQSDIILVVGVILISLLSFAMGYIFAKQQEKTPIKIESGDEALPHLNFRPALRDSMYEGGNYWSRDNWIISGLEIG